MILGTYRNTQEILQRYRQTIPTVKLWGPTQFEPLIQRVARNAGDANGKQYEILLILTDGAVTVFSATVNTIAQQACKKPISIVIAGIGGADFGAMDKLDGDERSISTRDIVQ